MTITLDSIFNSEIILISVVLKLRYITINSVHVYKYKIFLFQDVVIINPRRACAARVTVVVLCVCLSVCLFVCLRLFSHYGLRGGS